MLVKSKECPNHMKHQQEFFELLRTNDMKLNTLKCAFGFSSGKFLGFMVTDESKTHLFLIHFSGMFLTILDLFLFKIMKHSPTLCFSGVD